MGWGGLGWSEAGLGLGWGGLGSGFVTNYLSADVKNPQTDIIPYLHLKDHSAFEHQLMTHDDIS